MVETTKRQEVKNLQPGDLVDRFRIIKPLGSGGMGDVYFALDTDRFMNVALKVLHRGHPNFEKLRKRFALEAEVYRKIAHPNIVGMVGEGSFEDIDYIALEHIRGTSLLNVLNEKGVLPLDEAQSYMVDLIYALNAAHQKDVIHRDIKPHNIMITKGGVAKLIDFGVAKETEVLLGDDDRSIHVEELASGDLSASGNTHGISSSSGSTGTGHVVGTLAYSSPEQLQCQKIDGRSDIYSLGLVLYELFTGMRPLAGNSASDILLHQAKLDTKIVMPSTIQPEINRDIEKMILKMIRYAPGERYQSSVELIETIHRLGLEATSAATGTEETRAEQQRSKHLASLELADTYYWKAMGLIDEGRYVSALREFDKLFHTTAKVPESLCKTITHQVDLLFWTKYPLIPTLPGELPKDYLGDRLEFVSFIELLGEILALYRHLNRHRSTILAFLSLDRNLRWAIEERPDVYTCCEKAIARIRSYEEYRWAHDSAESLREGGIAEDLALARAISQLDVDEGNLEEAIELMSHRALLLTSLREDKKAYDCIRALLQLKPESRDGLGLAVFHLAERGIRIPSYVDSHAIFLEVYLLMGLFDAAATQIRKDLHGDVSDLSVHQRIINMYRRAGLEQNLGYVYFQMAELLVDQDCPERVRRLLQKSLELSPHNLELVDKIKGLKNIHKIFSIQELSAIGSAVLRGGPVIES